MCLCAKTRTTDIYTLSLHDALPISSSSSPRLTSRIRKGASRSCASSGTATSHPASEAASPSLRASGRSEEHTSELQSRQYLVCPLLLEKKNTVTSKVAHNLQREPST